MNVSPFFRFIVSYPIYHTFSSIMSGGGMRKLFAGL